MNKIEIGSASLAKALGMSLPTIQFFLAWVSLFLALRILWSEFGRDFQSGFGISVQKAELQRVFRSIQEIEEILGSGIVPSQESWQRLRTLKEPWGSLTYESLQELRSSGGAVLPTLKRLKALVSAQLQALSDAKARSAQASAQAGVCVLLIPILGVLLHELLPGVSESPWLWTGICLMALVLSGIGASWLMRMADEARWAGLKGASRTWILASLCAGERFLALIRSGTPADLAWVRCCELLSKDAPGLALAWGHSIWKVSPAIDSNTTPSARILIEAGEGLRKAVQLSLMEGRPCGDRVEAVLLALSQEIRSRIETELSVLPARALKPLFIFVAPGLFSLLAIGIFLSFRHVSAGGF